MHIVTVDNFVCCLRLETAGYLFGTIGSCLTALAIVLMIALGVMSALMFEDLSNIIAQDNQIMAGHEWLTKFLLESQIVFFAVLVVFTIYLMICFYAHVSLIVGTKNRNYERLIPFLVITVIGFAQSFIYLVLVTPTAQNIINVAISSVINIYVYICVYSLYIKLQNESKYKFPEA